MVRRPGSTGRYAPKSGPIMLRVSFVAHDPLRSNEHHSMPLSARASSDGGTGVVMRSQLTEDAEVKIERKRELVHTASASPVRFCRIGGDLVGCADVADQVDSLKVEGSGAALQTRPVLSSRGDRRWLVRSQSKHQQAVPA